MPCTRPNVCREEVDIAVATIEAAAVAQLPAGLYSYTRSISPCNGTESCYSKALLTSESPQTYCHLAIWMHCTLLCWTATASLDWRV